MTTFTGKAQSVSEHENDAIYQKAMLYEMMNAINSMDTRENDLKSFKKYIEEQRRIQTVCSAQHLQEFNILMIQI